MMTVIIMWRCWIHIDVEDDKEQQVSQFRSLPTHPTTHSHAKDDDDDEEEADDDDANDDEEDDNNDDDEEVLIQNEGIEFC